MATQTAWVGKCLVHTQPIADEPHQHPWNAECYAAVWTDSKPHFEQILRAHFKAQGQYLVWAEEVFSVLHWLHRHGHHPTIINLAKIVDETHGMEFSSLILRDKGGKPPAVPTYLTITEQTLPALPHQEKIPRWEQDWIVPELKDLLFGQPNEDELLRTYLIVDAGLRTKITVIYDLEQLDVPVRSLVRAEMVEELREVAPYLIDMTLPDKAWEDRAQVPAFHIDFIANHWQKGTGIIVRTSAAMDAVWTHFHQFVRARVENTQEWLFFRYWDPRVAPTYFANIQTQPEQVAVWCTLQTQEPLQQIIVNTAQQDTWVITPQWQKLAKCQMTAETMPFQLTQAWLEQTAIHHQGKYVRALFIRDYPDLARTLNDNLQIAFSEHLARKFRQYRLQKSYSKETYLLAATFLGTRFDEDINWPEIAIILKKQEPCYLRMIELKTALFKARDKIYGEQYQHYARALTNIIKQSEQQLFTLADEPKAFDTILQLFPEKARHLSEHQIYNLIDLSNTQVKQHFSPRDHRIGTVILFTHLFILGSGCLNDPLHLSLIHI